MGSRRLLRIADVHTYRGVWRRHHEWQDMQDDHCRIAIPLRDLGRSPQHLLGSGVEVDRTKDSFERSHFISPSLRSVRERWERLVCQVRVSRRRLFSLSRTSRMLPNETQALYPWSRTSQPRGQGPENSNLRRLLRLGAVGKRIAQDMSCSSLKGKEQVMRVAERMTPNPSVVRLGDSLAA